MDVPVKVFGEYVACFKSYPEEDVSMRRHFIKECGWTESAFKKIKDFDWFRVEASLWKDGKELATEHLGCCCYKSEEEFYTTFAGDYWSDMIHECAVEIADPELLQLVDAWRDGMTQDSLESKAEVQRG